jgi:hypothetical protein
MKSSVKILLTGLAAFAAGAALVFYFVKATPKPAGAAADEAPAAAPVKLKQGANGEAIISLDAETQARLGLKTATPVAAQRLPELKGYGRVVDPAVLSAAVADMKSAAAAAEVSKKELERLEALTAQNNVSAKNLEAARAAAARDAVAATAASVKFIADWGSALTRSENEALTAQIFSGDTELVRVDLPPGEILPSSPGTARIVALGDETKPVEAAYFDTTAGVDSLTQSQTFYFLVKSNLLMAGAAVTGWLKMSGAPADGVVVPSDAVLRYEGKGWIYVQTGTNDFTRTEIPLDRPLNGGWFDSRNLSATNQVVVTGAQTVLSAELSSGNFNSGSRD